MRIYATGDDLKGTQYSLAMAMDGVIDIYGCRYDIPNKTVIAEANRLTANSMGGLGVKKLDNPRGVFKSFVVNTLTKNSFVDFFGGVFQVASTPAQKVLFDIQPTPSIPDRLFVTADEGYYLTKAIKRNCPKGRKLFQEKKLKAQEDLSLLNIYATEDVLRAIEKTSLKNPVEDDSNQSSRNALEKAVFSLVGYLRTSNLTERMFSCHAFYERMKKVTVGQLQNYYLKTSVDKDYTHLVRFYVDKPAEIIGKRKYSDA